MTHNDDEEFIHDPSTLEPEDHSTITAVPTLDYWFKTYAKSCDGNDQKAIKIFREFESLEKYRRLQSEVLSIKEGKVSKKVLARILTKKREQQYQGYENWAARVLIWMAEKKK